MNKNDEVRQEISRLAEAAEADPETTFDLKTLASFGRTWTSSAWRI